MSAKGQTSAVFLPFPISLLKSGFFLNFLEFSSNESNSGLEPCGRSKVASPHAAKVTQSQVRSNQCNLCCAPFFCRGVVFFFGGGWGFF